MQTQTCVTRVQHKQNAHKHKYQRHTKSTERRWQSSSLYTLSRLGAMYSTDIVVQHLVQYLYYTLCPARMQHSPIPPPPSISITSYRPRRNRRLSRQKLKSSQRLRVIMVCGALLYFIVLYYRKDGAHKPTRPERGECHVCASGGAVVITTKCANRCLQHCIGRYTRHQERHIARQLANTNSVSYRAVK